ncbi:ankyrin repeat domain-containing protein [Rhodohalobacter sp. 8-1]|uniref:ankyrin repeat domain-containing protein n=1 Tax=Rhodohalobacter sp. 8-1 TaxID=3131972 RepID=UPI0030ECA4B8
MKSIIATLIAISLATFAPLNAMQTNHTTDTDFVVAENIIEAVNNIDIISLNVLLAEGATVDTVDQAGNSPLMLATKIGNPRMIDIVLAHNPDVNRRNNSGDTALMVASANGILSIVKDLKENGADQTLRNNKGFNSVQIALRNGHASVAEFLNGTDVVSFSR